MSSCIAFCFLTYDIIIRYDIWNKFFENINNNKYIVFIHPKFIKDFNWLSSWSKRHLSYILKIIINLKRFTSILPK